MKFPPDDRHPGDNTERSTCQKNSINISINTSITCVKERGHLPIIFYTYTIFHLIVHSLT